jgi:hypothetical protein
MSDEETRVVRLVRALLSPAADLEEAFQQLATERTLDNATDATQNLIGKLIGQAREGYDDESYRALQRARIKANRSSGLGDQVLIITRLVLSGYAALAEVLAVGTMSLALLNQGNAAFVVRVDNMDLPWDLAKLLVEKFLRKIPGVAIRPILEFVVQLDAALDAHLHAFAFDDGDGWGDTLDATSGGELAAAME